jgi:hypothetical protein
MHFIITVRVNHPYQLGKLRSTECVIAAAEVRIVRMVRVV